MTISNLIKVTFTYFGNYPSKVVAAIAPIAVLSPHSPSIPGGIPFSASCHTTEAVLNMDDFREKNLTVQEIPHYLSLLFQYRDRELPTLEQALHSKDTLLLKFLIEQGAVINEENELFLLYQAVETQNYEALEILVNAGANINATYQGCPLILAALKFNNVEILNKLISLGAKPFIGSSIPDSPLKQAISTGSIGQIGELIHKGFDIEERNGSGQTPLLAAAQSEVMCSINKLMELGANIHAIDLSGQTLLHYVTRMEKVHFQVQMAFIQKLIDLGVNLNAQTTSGMTPLHFFAKAGQIPAMVLLMKHGADIHLADNTGQTPLAYLPETLYPQERASIENALNAPIDEKIEASTGERLDLGPVNAIRIALRKSFSIDFLKGQENVLFLDEIGKIRLKK